MTSFSPPRPVHHLRRYRQIAGIFLRHGFGFVFEHLDPEWRPWQRAVPPRSRETTWPTGDLPGHFRQALEELGPAFVKLGQILSTRPDLLPSAYIAELSKLRDAVPAAPWESIRQVLTQSYGRPPELVFAAIDAQPLAAASLAQVHAATLAGGEAVVVKVQRPNLAATIATDMEILMAVARAAQHSVLGRIYDFVAIAEDFRSSLQQEMDYRREGRNADRFRANFAHESSLHIPRVYWELTSERVLVLERI